MDIKTSYPEYASIEEHIRRARLERSIALAHLLADAVDGATRGLRRFFASSAAALRPDPVLTLPKRPAAR